MRIYVSYSIGFKDWDFSVLHKGSDFKLACPTMKFKEEAHNGVVRMLDWDYREWLKKPERVEDRHLEIAKNYDLDIIMSMDAWKENIDKCISYTEELSKYAKKVLIPFHVLDPRLLDFDLSYPNANWFAVNVFPTVEYRNNVRHILGGSPSSQINLVTTSQADLLGNPIKFTNVQSVDGNQLFNAAIITGKFWVDKKPYWKKPKVGENGKLPTNQQLYALSVSNVTKSWEKAEKLISRINGIDSTSKEGST